MTISIIAAVSCDPVIHDIWLTLRHFSEHLRTKNPNDDGIQFVTKELEKQFNKVFPHKLFLEANNIEISNGKKVMVFLH